jgi:hypothetical protein
VVLPASGCEMIAKVRRCAAASAIGEKEADEVTGRDAPIEPGAGRADAAGGGWLRRGDGNRPIM